jgi:L-2,4-diaminobutyric acid acetyltransferase
VWQVAVSAELRGQGLARRMLRELLARPAVRGCLYLETTVSLSNEPSLKLFHRLARDLGAPAARQVMFQEEDFGDERHESETLIRIGPFGPNQRQGETPNESRNLRSP